MYMYYVHIWCCLIIQHDLHNIIISIYTNRRMVLLSDTKPSLASQLVVEYGSY